MYGENFNNNYFNKGIYEDIEKIHQEIEEAKYNCPEELTKLYNKELNRSLFLGEPIIKRYSNYNPY